MKKSGFTLAEVLISLAIASIIAVLGTSVAKKGIANAYNGYYYTGYKGLSDAIAVANSEYVNNSTTCDWDTTLGTNSCIQSLADTLELSDPVSDFRTAPNGVSYKFTKSGNYYIVEMHIPSIKQTIGDETRNYKSTCLVFNPTDIGELVIPSNDTIGDYCSKQDDNLQNNPHLLSFYIDNGTVGRIQQKYQVNTGHITTAGPPQYNSYPPIIDAQHAICYAAYGNFLRGIVNELTVNGTSVLNCAGITPTTDEQWGIVRFVDPKKVY